MLRPVNPYLSASGVSPRTMCATHAGTQVLPTRIWDQKQRKQSLSYVNYRTRRRRTSRGVSALPGNALTWQIRSSLIISHGQLQTFLHFRAHLGPV